jgi:hypothetical protein
MIGPGSNLAFQPALTATNPYLLDQGLQAGVGGAYSVRRLLAGYKGPAIRVRRSSDSAEQDIYFTKDGDLDEAALLAFIGIDSGFVTTEYDQSGIGRNLVQATAANQPEIALAGSINRIWANPATAAGSTFHIGAIVKSFLYDTSKDSDKGVWRKRCTGTSWFNEAINGAWLGEAANELAARGDNLVSYPEQFDNAAWTKSNATVTPNAIIASDGSSYAQKLVETTANNVHLALQNFTAVAGVYAYSIDLKAAERTYAAVAFQDPTNGYPGIVVNLATGAFVSNLINAPASYSITPSPKGQGWYRVTILATLTAGANRDLRAYIYQGASTNSFTGDGTSGIYVGQAKLNLVGALPSTYSASPELVTNGGFDTDLSGWTATGGATQTWDSAGRVKIAIATAEGGTSRAIATVIGRVYTATMTNATGSGVAAARIRIGTTLGNAEITQTSLIADSTGTFTFVATATTTYISAHFQSGTVGAFMYFDNISLKEVTTLATPYVPYSTLSGNYYHNTTDGKYYALGSTYGTQVETFRGNVREFPEQVIIVAEAAKVVLYDATQPGLPMWMVFNQASSSSGMIRNGTLSSVSAVNGMLVVARANTEGISLINFVSDRAEVKYSGGYGFWLSNIARRNSADSWGYTGNAALGIVNGTTNDVAMTVLNDAPTDPATGLPVPTVAVATAGGISVIKQDGTVVNSASTAPVKKCGVTSSGRLVYGDFPGAAYGSRVVAISGIAAAFTGTTFDIGSIPSVGANGGALPAGANLAFFSGASGISLLRENPATPAKSMVAYITNAYNTGWQVGDSRIAALADTVVETVTASGELVTNGTFGTDTAGWVSSTAYASTAVATAGEMIVTPSTAYGSQMFAFTTVVGKTYKVQGSVRRASGTTNSVYLAFRTSLSAGDAVFGATTTSATAVASTFDFVATGTTSYVACVVTSAADTGGFDNISCQLASPDRSVKNSGLVLFGSLIKAAVASGANLVNFSGFSTVNYLEQPFSSNLDFATSGFDILAWVAVGSSQSIQETIWCRDSPTTGVSWRLYVNASGYLVATVYDGTTTRTATGTTSVRDGAFRLVEVSYLLGTVTILVNGAAYASATGAALLTLNNSLATFRIGLDAQGANPGTNVKAALVRASATVCSADQSAQIYRDELPLFQANAQCTIDGTSAAVTALAYDELTNKLHVGTSWGRSAFIGLKRVESEALANITSLSAYSAGIIAGTSSKANYAAQQYCRSRPAMRTDGATQHIASGTFAVAQPFTRSSVMQFLRVTTAGSPILLDSAAAPEASLQWSADGTLAMYNGTTTAALKTGVAVNDRATTVETFNGASSSLSYNGALSAGSNAGSAGLNGLRVGTHYGAGAGRFSFTLFGETIIWTSAVSTPDRLAIEASSKAYWGTP